MTDVFAFTAVVDKAFVSDSEHRNTGRCGDMGEAYVPQWTFRLK